MLSQALILDDNVEGVGAFGRGQKPILTHSVRIKRRISAGRLRSGAWLARIFGLESEPRRRSMSAIAILLPP